MEDRRRREHENEERMREMREQIGLLQWLVTEWGTAATPNRGSGNRDEPWLTHLTEQDDIEAYLLTFERMMQAYEINRARWAYRQGTTSICCTKRRQVKRLRRHKRGSFPAVQH